ncbi:MAG TPA: hypothetical protein VN253_13755 [Kofleriaceae bacterium]|nr:hypothetical protein [Kofleriaceae bacterium]
MRNVVGKPVTGSNFFGREQELEELGEITRDEHVLLLAPRRVGKTSLLLALQSEVSQERSAIGVYVSVAAATNELQFVRSVLQAIYETRPGKRLKPNVIAAWLRRHGRRLKGVKVAGTGFDLEGAPTPEWQEEADKVFTALATMGTPWLIMIDELPTLVLSLARQDPSGARVRAFLQWFRNLRQLPLGTESLRFVLAGSIGLDNVTNRHRLTDTINDLRDWRLGPFSRESADRFLAELARGYQLELGPELRGAICDHAEWLIPYHLQVIFSALREQCGGRTPPSAALLDRAIEALLSRKAYFAYWDERLHDAFGAPEDDLARAMLATCARDPRGATASALQQSIAREVPNPRERAAAAAWILDVLGNDGYLVDEAGRSRFRSGLLRRYWLSQLA